MSLYRILSESGDHVTRCEAAPVHGVTVIQRLKVETVITLYPHEVDELLSQYVATMPAAQLLTALRQRPDLAELGRSLAWQMGAPSPLTAFEQAAQDELRRPLRSEQAAEGQAELARRNGVPASTGNRTQPGTVYQNGSSAPADPLAGDTCACGHAAMRHMEPGQGCSVTQCGCARYAAPQPAPKTGGAV